jgi:hypothetical protein
MKTTRNCRLEVMASVFAFLAGVCNAQAPVERMQQVVQPYADAQLFMGSVLVAQNSKVLFSKSYGWAGLGVEHTEFVHGEIPDRLCDQTIHRGLDFAFGRSWKGEDRQLGEEISARGAGVLAQDHHL